jgi:hypothetical protein
MGAIAIPQALPIGTNMAVATVQDATRRLHQTIGMN